MKPEIIEKDEFMIIGIKYEGKNENGEISNLWFDFLRKSATIKNTINKSVCYGLELYSHDFKETGVFTYIAGVEVSDDSVIPEDMVSYRVKKNKYAVFTLNGVVEDLPSTIPTIYSKYLPEYGLKPNDMYDFEYYTEEFNADKKNSKLYFYVPIKQ